MPPLSALRAFSAWADSDSVAQAAARIGVTHAAISQQIRALENHLGLRLVSRAGRALALSDDGRRLAEVLRDGFGRIDEVITDLTGAEQDRPLQITTTPMFASGWLVPRLGALRAAHPDIDLVIDPSPALRPLEPGGYDIALRHGGGTWEGLEARLLLPTGLVVVGAPSLVEKRSPGDLGALADLPWLAELETSEATRFLARHGVARTKGVGLTHLPGNMMLDAARAGQGLAVASQVFVEADITRGELVVMYRDPNPVGYYLLTRPGILRASVQAFVRWALRQAAGERMPDASPA